jgi:hypothetical protein
MITKIKQLFCKHKYVEMREISKTYQCISGERIYIVCEKCGKIKDSYFREYEGMGHK